MSQWKTQLRAQRTNIVLFVGFFLISLAAGIALFQNRGSLSLSGDWVETDWRGLAGLDYITGEAHPELKAIDNKAVRIAGFMVPLEDNLREVTEFLLVPTPQACIHVPAPPPNQMVHVVMEKGRATKVAYGPIWVYGELNIRSMKSMYGESSFLLKGFKVEVYQ
jgi:hypothetical protein